MKHAKVVLVLFSVLWLAACAEQMPPLNFTAPSVGVSAKRISAELKSITVSMAGPHERTGEIDFIVAESAGTAVGSGAGITQTWRTALEDSLLRMAIFRDDEKQKVSLAVKVLKLDVPSAGIEFTTEAAARYELIDRNTGSIIYTQDIVSKGTTPADFAFVGAIRARESVNRAVQNNITLFLQALETVDAKKPMFPTPASLKGPGV